LEQVLAGVSFTSPRARVEEEETLGKPEKKHGERATFSYRAGLRNCGRNFCAALSCDGAPHPEPMTPVNYLTDYLTDKRMRLALPTLAMHCKRSTIGPLTRPRRKRI
jgi:hypothetical protein